METPSSSYQRLGYKTFWLFVFTRMSAAMIFFLISLGMLYLANVNLPERFVTIGAIGEHWHGYVRIAGFASSTLFFLSLGFALLAGWLEYFTYKFSLDEDAFRVKRGILNKEEIAIPYRQIQDVSITRDLGYQILGLSRVEIHSAGHEDPNEKDESEGILPAIDKDMAEKIQAELLKRANVEKVVQMNDK